MVTTLIITNVDFTDMDFWKQYGIQADTMNICSYQWNLLNQSHIYNNWKIHNLEVNYNFDTMNMFEHINKLNRW